jgi:hypothetical protein
MYDVPAKPRVGAAANERPGQRLAAGVAVVEIESALGDVNGDIVVLADARLRK